MKSVAHWARNHIMAARLIITICHIIIASLACYVGVALKDHSIFIPVQVLWSAIGLFLLIVSINSRQYFRKAALSKHFTVGTLVLISSFVILCSSSNQRNLHHFIFYSSLYGSFPESRVDVTTQPSRPSYKDVKKQWKAFRKVSERASAGSIILAVLLTIMLSLLLLYLSCSLACNGNGALSYLVLFAGMVGIFFIARAVLVASKRRNT